MTFENEPKLNIETIKEKLLGAVALSKTPLEALAWAQAYGELVRANLFQSGQTSQFQERGRQVPEKNDGQVQPLSAESQTQAVPHTPQSEDSELRNLATLLDGLSANIHSRTKNLLIAPNSWILFQASNAVYKAEEEALCADSPKRKS